MLQQNLSIPQIFMSVWSLMKNLNVNIYWHPFQPAESCAWLEALCLTGATLSWPYIHLSKVKSACDVDYRCRNIHQNCSGNYTCHACDYLHRNLLLGPAHSAPSLPQHPYSSGSTMLQIKMQMNFSHALNNSDVKLSVCFLVQQLGCLWRIYNLYVSKTFRLGIHPLLLAN